MKKLISLMLVLAMVMSFAACAAKEDTENTEPSTQATEPVKAQLEGTMEELLNKVITQQPVEFMGGVIPVDLTDTSEDGLWAVKSYTGLDSAAQITEAAVYEPMMGSIAYSMVMVRVAEGADAKTVAEQMKSGIDTRKWICVQANDVMAAGYGDVVMFIMLDNQSGMTAQSFVDAFKTVCGAELDFVI